MGMDGTGPAGLYGSRWAYYNCVNDCKGSNMSSYDNIKSSFPHSFDEKGEPKGLPPGFTPAMLEQVNKDLENKAVKHFVEYLSKLPPSRALIWAHLMKMSHGEITTYIRSLGEKDEPQQ